MNEWMIKGLFNPKTEVSFSMNGIWNGYFISAEHGSQGVNPSIYNFVRYPPPRP